MGFRFSRRIKLLPGVHLNLGLKSVSLSLGPRGAGVTVGTRGVTGHVGVPGTGLSYRTRLGAPDPVRRPAACPKPPPVSIPEALRIRFDGLDMHLLDEDGTPLAEPVLGAARKAFREPILDALDARAAQLNAAAVAGDLPTAPPVPDDAYPVPKPVKPRDPRDLDPAHPDRAAADAAWADYMAALGPWRAAEAEHRRKPANPDATLARIEARLAAIAWPRETLISLDADGPVLRADVDLPEIEDLPTSQVAVSRTQLVLVAKPLSAAAMRRAYERHICDIAARIVDEAFAAGPTFAMVEVAGYTQRPGVADDVYVLSANVLRERWTGTEADPVAALAPFRRRSAIDAGGVVRAVVPLGRA